MVFSEIYSAYYNTVAQIIGQIIDGECDEKELQKTVAQKAFGESFLTILPSLKSGKWQLMHPDMTTPLEHKPTMPLTLLQKQWLKAISLDPRFKLFGITLEGLEDVEPLFTSEDYYIYDKYSDGDDYCDEGYIRRFRTILSAIREGYPLRIELVNRFGKAANMRAVPKRIEYSAKDDKFRLVIAGGRRRTMINLGRMTDCRRYYGDNVEQGEDEKSQIKTVTMTVIDERNALERVMLHFAHFEKRTERIDELHYRLTINYDKDDATELVIRILSFGPMIKVEEPQSFVDLVKDRLIRQKNCNLR